MQVVKLVITMETLSVFMELLSEVNLICLLFIGASSSALGAAPEILHHLI